MTVAIDQPKLDISASTRLPSDWNDVIESNSPNRSTWIREAVKQRLIAENLIDVGESYFSHKNQSVQKNTLNTLHTSKTEIVLRTLLKIIVKQRAQKKPEIAAQANSAHSSQG